MEIRQLEVFISVAKSLSFSKAAETLFVSQSTISAHIGALERELGVQLLARNTKEVYLTKAGVEFLTYARNILSLRDEAVDHVGGMDKAHAIDIISSTIPAQHLLPEIIASFHKLHPNILFHVDQADSGQVAKKMRSFHYDFGMTGTLPDSSRLKCYPVYNDELILIMPKYVQNSDEQIRNDFPRFMLENDIVMRESGSGTRTEIESMLKKCGVSADKLKVSGYFPDAQSVLLAVSHGMGISIVSSIAAKMYLEKGLIRAVEMKNPSFWRSIYILHNKELHPSPIQQAFMDFTRQFYSTE